MHLLGPTDEVSSFLLSIAAYPSLIFAVAMTVAAFLFQLPPRKNTMSTWTVMAPTYVLDMTHSSFELLLKLSTFSHKTWIPQSPNSLATKRVFKRLWNCSR
mmetsp:Transcript_23187/g.34237  ORF Transcript_23187/g.34237 Transcript_23187/m.34237 type:complete len:101 (-) Transcript_23187:206-508(-)